MSMGDDPAAMKWASFFALGTALVALGWLQVVGTSTKLAFQWPAITVIAAGGVVAAVSIQRQSAGSLGCWGSVFLFSIFLVGRALVSEVSYFGRLDAILITTAYIFYGLIVANAWSLKSRINWVLVVAGLVAIAGCGVAFYQKFGRVDFNILPGYSRSRADYPAGFFNLHTHFSGYLVLVLPYFLSRLVFGKVSRGGIVWWGGCALAALVGIVLSSSRLGYVGAIAGGAAVLVLSVYVRARLKARPFHMAWLALGVVILGGFAVVGLSGLEARSGKGAGLKRFFGHNSRIYYWEAALDQFADCPTPLVGDGSLSYSYHYARHFPAKNWVGSGEPKFVHNDYLQLLTDYGIVGCVLAFTAVYIHLIKGFGFLRWARRRRVEGVEGGRSDRSALVVGALSSTAVLLVISVFDFNLHLLANLLVGVLGMGILACFGGQNVDPPARRGRSKFAKSLDVLLRVSVGGASVGLLMAATRYLPADVDFERGERRYSTGDRVESLSFMHRILERDSDNFGAWHTIARIRESAWREEELPFVVVQYLSNALAAYRSALELFPESYGILGDTGHCLALIAFLEEDKSSAEEGFAEGFRYVDKAVGLAPKSRFSHIKLGEWWSAKSLRFEFDGDLEGALQAEGEAKAAYRMSVDLTLSNQRPDSYQVERLVGSRLRIKELAAKLAEQDGGW